MMLNCKSKIPGKRHVAMDAILMSFGIHALGMDAGFTQDIATDCSVAMARM